MTRRRSDKSEPRSGLRPFEWAVLTPLCLFVLPVWVGLRSGGYHQMTHVLYVWFPLILAGAVGMLMTRPNHSSRLILGAFALYLLGWIVAQVVLAGTGGGGLG